MSRVIEINAHTYAPNKDDLFRHMVVAPFSIAPLLNDEVVFVSAFDHLQRVQRVE